MAQRLPRLDRPVNPVSQCDNACIDYMYQWTYVTCMAKSRRRPAGVREPVQVYLASDDSALLSRLVAETGLSKAEILRRGVRSFAREQAGDTSPMLRFVAETSAEGWPDDVAASHDDVLSDAYRGARKGRR